MHERRYGDVSLLQGAKFTTGGHTPAAIHLGDGTGILVLDDRMTPEQRAAIECLWRGDGAESPFDEFASVTSIWFDPIVAPIEVHPDGIRSSVKVAGGDVYDLALDRVRNPVTLEEEITFLDHPTGFNSKYSELGTSAVAKFRSDVASSDHIGKYAKYAKVEYSGPP